MPKVRPAFTRHLQQSCVDPVARLAGSAYGRGRLGVLEFQSDRRLGARLPANLDIACAVARRDCRDRIRLLRREQKRGMRGKHRMEQRLFPLRPKRVEIPGIEQHFQAIEVGHRVDRGDQVAKPRRASPECIALEFRHHRLDRVEIERSGLDMARQIEAELKDRVEKRGLRGSRVKLTQASEKIGDGSHRR